MTEKFTQLQVLPSGEFKIVKVTKKAIYVQLDKNTILCLPKSDFPGIDFDKELNNDQL